MRPDIVEAAVQFLANPQVSSASMKRKVEFLEGKGLTGQEIEAAIAKSAAERQEPSSTTTEDAAVINNTTIKSPALTDGSRTMMTATTTASSTSSIRSILMGVAMSAGIGIGSIQLLKVNIN
jgi:peroxin-14